MEDYFDRKCEELKKARNEYKKQREALENLETLYEKAKDSLKADEKAIYCFEFVDKVLRNNEEIANELAFYKEKQKKDSEELEKKTDEIINQKKVLRNAESNLHRVAAELRNFNDRDSFLVSRGEFDDLLERFFGELL